MQLENFNNFFIKMNDSLNTSLDITYKEKTNNKWYGEFLVDEYKYFFLIKSIETINENIYFTKFGVDGVENSYKKLNDNSNIRSLSVLSTIRKELNDFIDEESPNILFFIPSDNNRSRLKLYEKFINEVANKNTLYYDYQNDVHGNKVYMIVKKSYDNKNLNYKEIIKYSFNYNF